MGAQQHPRAIGLRREIKGVVHFPRRVAFREIQLGEIIVICLDIGTFGDSETHVGENRSQLIGDLTDWVDPTGFDRRLANRQRDIDGFGVSLASSVAAASLSFAAAMAAVTRSLNPLIAGPWTLRSSGVMVPSVFSSADTEPLLPSAATRTASNVASSFAEATLARISCSSVSIFDMAHHRVMRALDPRILSRLALCPPERMAGKEPGHDTKRYYAGNAALAFSTIA